MVGTSLSKQARIILCSALGMHTRRRTRWGSRNTWSGPSSPTAGARELLEAGLIVPHTNLGPDTTVYRVTVAGMRVAGLGPAAIERCLAL